MGSIIYSQSAQKDGAPLNPTSPLCSMIPAALLPPSTQLNLRQSLVREDIALKGIHEWPFTLEGVLQQELMGPQVHSCFTIVM